MKMKRLLVYVMVLVEVLMCCEGCWKQERDALISLYSRMGNNLYSKDSIDCCQWDGVECNTTSGRVAKLALQSLGGALQLNYSDFFIFKDLKTLDLTNMQISNCTATHQGLINLEVLYLSEVNNWDNANSILSCVDGLSSLKSLSLAYQMNGNPPLKTFQTVLGTISPKMPHLEVLDIGVNNLTNEILPSLMGFTSLKELNLRDIGLDSVLHIQGLCATLKNLEILDLSGNNFNNIDIASALSGLSSLKSLNLQRNQITPMSIHNFSKLKNLEILDLSNNNLNGSIDISGLSTLTNLKILDFSSNQLEDFVVHKGTENLSRLDILALDSNMINGSNLIMSLWAFPSIRNLTLRQNRFKGKLLAEGFGALSKLEYLILDYSSNLENDFFKSIGDLSSLKVLSVLECGINGTLQMGDWYKLKKLEELDLSFNNFVGQLPSSFHNMTSLQTLKLTSNHFIGNIGLKLASFTSLEYLDFEGNQFLFPMSFTPFSNLSNLKFIYGSGNKVILESKSSLKTWIPKFQLQVLQLSSKTHARSIPFPNFLLYQYNLTSVDFTDCNLRGQFPNWLLENNTKMESLLLQNCSFIGGFHLPSRPCLSLSTIDISDNAITGQMLSNNISSIFPNLQSLYMSRNEIHGSIPSELTHLESLVDLDLSDNQLSGEIPRNFTKYWGQLSILRLSNNNLHGLIPHTLSMILPSNSIFLNDNSFSGSLPSNFFNSPDTQHLDISNNYFSGKIPRQMENSTGLIELLMSNNQFEGSIPTELTELKMLAYLDLSQNNLVGCVPSFVNSSANFIHLNNNKLSCLSKNMFGKTSSLMTLDLSNNELTTGIHDIVYDLRHTGLNILLMRGNHMIGNIPKQICHLQDLNILDLSNNSFVGEIPSCLGKMPFANKDPEGSRGRFNGITHAGKGDYLNRIGKEKTNFTSKKRVETYTTNILIYMSGIDLSHNKLNGSIPYELGNLTRIRSLNLSNNFFTGKIPATFSNLVQVESLDLSFNILSGEIPLQLSGLTFLEVFSVAHNNLSGTTPERKGQFITFDESSYEGNQFLCGPPLPRNCSPSGQSPDGLNKDEDNDSWIDIYVFRVSFVVAYISILLVTVTVLYINSYWRKAWFYYTGSVAMNCYYFFKGHFC